MACGASHAELPVNLEGWQQSEASGRHLIFLDSLYGKSQYGDAYGWRESLKELEKGWFEPLLNMLKKGVIKQLTIATINEGVARNFIITRSSFYKFWCMGKPLSTHIK